MGYVETQRDAVNNVTEISISKCEFIPSQQFIITSGGVLPRLEGGGSALAEVSMSKNKTALSV